MKLIIMKSTIQYINVEAQSGNPTAINKINEINNIIEKNKDVFVEKNQYLILMNNDSIEK
jgi:hypothetical protein